ncbi:MAG: VOC family protein [Acidihalobacter sp.]|jgi:catechol 2,3-dioxygenase-like lactoylglutathione lyase family enzyme
MNDDGHVGSRAELEAQLVVEIFVRDLERSLAFYRALGFELARRTSEFAALRWDSAYLFLDQRPGSEAPTDQPLCANVRVVVGDVDRIWARVQALGARVIKAPCDQSYGLRDFTIADPDGFGVRFAQLLDR